MPSPTAFRLVELELFDDPRCNGASIRRRGQCLPSTAARVACYRLHAAVVPSVRSPVAAPTFDDATRRPAGKAFLSFSCRSRWGVSRLRADLLHLPSMSSDVPAPSMILCCPCRCDLLGASEASASHSRLDAEGLRLMACRP